MHAMNVWSLATAMAILNGGLGHEVSPDLMQKAFGSRGRGRTKPPQGATRLYGLKYRRHIPPFARTRDGKTVTNPDYVQLRMHPLGHYWYKMGVGGMFDPAEYRKAKN